MRPAHGVLAVVISLLLEALLRLLLSRHGLPDHDAGAVALHRDVVEGDGVEVVGDERAGRGVDAAGDVLAEQRNVQVDHKSDEDQPVREQEKWELHTQTHST